MKRIACILLFFAVAALCGCSWQLPDVNDPSYKYMYQETEAPDDSAVRIPVVGDSEAVDISTGAVSDLTEPNHSEAESSSDDVPVTEPFTEEPSVSDNTVDAGEIDLSITMPQQNGTMYTDSSPDNKFIGIVNDKKKIDKNLLVAVYSLPDTGQNYVFEFYSKEGRTVDDLRRVYLIDQNGKIVSVSASNSSERVGIGSVENWFSMNVLIKEVIFPAISDSIKQ